MIEHRALSELEFKACFAEPMQNITATAEVVVDIWPYVESLDLEELKLPRINDVHYVYRDGKNSFDQIILGTGRFNTLLVLVIELDRQEIFGHFVLDLNEEYGSTGILSQ